MQVGLGSDCVVRFCFVLQRPHVILMPRVWQQLQASCLFLMKAHALQQVRQQQLLLPLTLIASTCHVTWSPRWSSFKIVAHVFVIMLCILYEATIWMCLRCCMSYILLCCIPYQQQPSGLLGACTRRVQAWKHGRNGAQKHKMLVSDGRCTCCSCKPCRLACVSCRVCNNAAR